MHNLLNHPPHLPLIFPSILASDFADLGNDAQSLLDAGADGLHVDVMDGHFVPNLTIGPPLVKSLKKRFAETYLDVHLMVTHPEDFVLPFAEAGATGITFHIEATMGRKHHHELDVIHKVRDTGCQVGIAINPPTPAQAVLHLVEQVDLFLVMSVHPGFGGQKFMPEVLTKARTLRDAAPTHVRIEMDGGIDDTTITHARAHGVDTIVAGTYLFAAADRAMAVNALR